MNHFRTIPTGGWIALSLLVVAAIGACAPVAPDAGQDPSVLGSSPELPGSTSEGGGDNNNSFDSAQPVDVPATGELELTGAIASISDVDLYDLGPVSASDVVTVNVKGDGVLDPAAALFDANGTLLFVNDDRDVFFGLLDAQLDLTVAAPTDPCYLAIATSPSAPTAGNYTARISIARGAQTPTVRPQSVVLDFDGASGVSIGGGTPVDVPPFEARLIDPSFEGQTEAMIQTLLARVNQDFGGFNVVVRTSDDAPADPNVDTVVYFGTFNPALLGLADNVDLYNFEPSQQAIIYVETFALFMPLQPSVDEIAQALANVTSHEIGHLLGLNHTSDPAGIMDITATASQLLANQRFARSPLMPEIFPIGSQDAVVMLLASVGEVAAGAVTRGRFKTDSLSTAPAPLPGEGSLPKTLFASCGCRQCVARKIKCASVGQ